MHSYTGIGRRFLSLSIDILILLVPILAGLLIECKTVSVIIGWLYFSFMESSTLQATLGKKALGIKVTDVYGNRISFLRASIRYFCRFISAFIFFIGYIMAAFTYKKQTFHDMISNTVVTLNSPVNDLSNEEVERDALLFMEQNEDAAPKIPLLVKFDSVLMLVVGIAIVPINVLLKLIFTKEVHGGTFDIPIIVAVSIILVITGAEFKRGTVWSFFVTGIFYVFAFTRVSYIALGIAAKMNATADSLPFVGLFAVLACSLYRDDVLRYFRLSGINKAKLCLPSVITFFIFAFYYITRP
ncbi:MAG TPA: RDD family protein [Clostridia bacterium]